MITAMIRLELRREGGSKVVEVNLPRRLLTAIRSMNPEAVKVTFGVNESFTLGARELGEVVEETYKKRRRKGEVL